MKFDSDIEKFNNSGSSKPGEFEMWYFDAIDNDDDYYFTARIYYGNPEKVSSNGNPNSDNTNNYCRFRFFLYYQNRLIYDAIYDYKKEEFRIEESDGLVKMILDKNSFCHDKENDKYLLNINYSSAELESKFKAEFEFKPLLKKSSINKKTDHNLEKEVCWMPSPLCHVSGKIKVYRDYKRVKTIFDGKGYIDKTWGSTNSFNKISYSNWGKFIRDDYSFIFFVSESKGENKFMKLQIFKDNLLLLEKEDFKLLTKKTFFTNKIKSIEIESNDLKVILKNEINIESGEFGDKYISKFEMYHDEKKVIDNVYGFFQNVVNN
ncbi:MAG TPA: hypothetical protein PLD63_09845 [Ignavibacteria bacterium]|nr:hypothetical protein [Ignavibacteria bacterium]HQY52661.1 hypothetical protein [Ignavibacteria bacterium]